MPTLAPLLEVQELDLACDRLAEKRRTLPERDALRRCHEQAGALDVAWSALEDRLAALRIGEHDLVREVAVIAAHAKEVETTLYAGTVRASKELTGLQAELKSLRARQSAIEEREMALLEEIERVESERADNRSARERILREAAAVEAALRDAESKIDAELAGHVASREVRTAGLPAAVLAEYAKLRARDRMAGRAAAPLRDGSCGGCRVKLPVLDHSRMKVQPEDALLLCPRCGRVLVR